MASHKSASIPIPDENVVVLDFGAQYTQLIARRVRECKVYCEILPCETPLAEIAKRKPIGIIFSGGPASCYEPGAPKSIPPSTNWAFRFLESATGCSS